MECTAPVQYSTAHRVSVFDKCFIAAFRKGVIKCLPNNQSPHPLGPSTQVGEGACQMCATTVPICTILYCTVRVQYEPTLPHTSPDLHCNAFFLPKHSYLEIQFSIHVNSLDTIPMQLPRYNITHTCTRSKDHECASPCILRHSAIGLSQCQRCHVTLRN